MILQRNLIFVYRAGCRQRRAARWRQVERAALEQRRTVAAFDGPYLRAVGRLDGEPDKILARVNQTEDLLAINFGVHGAYSGRYPS
jgi:hypothetical protein